MSKRKTGESVRPPPAHFRLCEGSVGSWPGLWEKVHLASQRVHCNLGKAKALSDIKISDSFPGKTHQDTEATLMSGLILTAKVHRVLTMCWAQT